MGAVNINSTNNRFTVNLDVPIEIPSNAYNITVCCKQLIMWNTVFNITNTNNQIFIGAPDVNDVRQDKLITVLLTLFRKNVALKSFRNLFDTMRRKSLNIPRCVNMI